jgi:hypothetical protein
MDDELHSKLEYESSEFSRLIRSIFCYLAPTHKIDGCTNQDMINLCNDLDVPKEVEITPADLSSLLLPCSFHHSSPINSSKYTK